MGEFEFEAQNGICIASEYSVEVNTNWRKVFIFGERSPTLDSNSVVFQTNREAIIFAAEMHKAIEEWADKWSGWEDIKFRSTEDKLPGTGAEKVEYTF